MKGPSSMVVDASVAIAILLREPPRDRALAILREASAEDVSTVVPELFWLEVVNTLGRRHGFGEERIVAAVWELRDLGIQSVPLEAELVFDIAILVAEAGLTAYDASYIALARHENARLATADLSMAEAAGKRVIWVGEGDHPRRVGEDRAAYGDDVNAWFELPTAGTLVARLRAEAASELAAIDRSRTARGT